MATNRGIIKTLKVQWHDQGDESRDLSDLLKQEKSLSPALDLYRKMCGGCHLWKRKGDRPGEPGARGGGCSDCHVVDPQERPSTDLSTFTHPQITTRIPSENCTKCHNRSARIGLSYFGRYESSGYGTPYRGAEFSERRLSGRRFYLNIVPDVHHGKAGMDCVDCHTATGLMGDGQAYFRLEHQVDITCEACHWPGFRICDEDSGLAVRLSQLNRKGPSVRGKVIGYTKKGTPLYNLQLLRGKIVFFRKRDGKSFEVTTKWFYSPPHKLKGHERLSCQACHSSWIPQCYGCHTLYWGSGKQRDWISGKMTQGRWEERRSFMRFERPSLALRFYNKVYPVSPCQVFVYPMDMIGNGRGVKKLRIFSLSAFDPHTTRKEVRQCDDCHGDPKTIGLGNGVLFRKGGRWHFYPVFDSMASGLGVDFPIDGFVDINGNVSHAFSRSSGRPFNAQELETILNVGLCIGCHSTYDDPIYGDFRTSLERFKQDRTLPCLK